MDRYASIYYISNLWILSLQMLVESSQEQIFCELSIFVSSVAAINPEPIACLAALCSVPQWLKLGALHLNISKPLTSLIGACFSS